MVRVVRAAEAATQISATGRKNQPTTPSQSSVTISAATSTEVMAPDVGGTGSGRGASLMSAICDGGDLVVAHPSGSANLDRVAFLLADQGAGQRRLDVQKTGLDIGLLLADDLI